MCADHQRASARAKEQYWPVGPPGLPCGSGDLVGESGFGNFGSEVCWSFSRELVSPWPSPPASLPWLPGPASPACKWGSQTHTRKQVRQTSREPERKTTPFCSSWDGVMTQLYSIIDSHDVRLVRETGRDKKRRKLVPSFVLRNQTGRHLLFAGRQGGWERGSHGGRKRDVKMGGEPFRGGSPWRQHMVQDT